MKPVPARILCVCLECGKQFSVTEGTIFNDSHLDLEKWFAAVALMVNAKKGLSALQLKRDIGCAYKTAWYLNHRIRKAMGIADAVDAEPLTGTVEADETYMGAKKYDKRRKRAKYDKEPVFGVVERGGKARTFRYAARNDEECRWQNQGQYLDPTRTQSIRTMQTSTEPLLDASRTTITKAWTITQKSGFAATFTPARLTAIGAF